MEILHSFDRNIRSISKYQTYELGEEYAESPYLIKENGDKGTVVFNCFTREIILFAPGEYETAFNPSNRLLVEKWYFVPRRWDQSTWYDFFEKQYRNTHKKKSLVGLSTYVILPTLGCNARCKYCFQCDTPKKVMTAETADAVSHFIWETYVGHVYLKWFGGEPLTNPEIITRICDNLRKDNVKFTSSIITNGLLLNRIGPNTIKSVWNLTQAQVTLDGTKEYSDSVKRWKSADGTEYDRVLRNIEYLATNGVSVSIRLNVAKDNSDSLTELVDMLQDRFYEYENVSIYPHILFDGLGEDPVAYTAEDNAALYRSCQMIHHQIREAGMDGLSNNMYSVQCSNCMGDNLSAVCISPTGSLTVCEHYCDDDQNVIGTVFEDGVDQATLEQWQVRYRDENCSSCTTRPLCTKIKMCPIGKCTEAEREYVEWRIRERLKTLCN